MSRAVIINQWPAAQIQPAKPSSPTCYLCQTRGAQIKSRTQQKQNTFVIHSSFFLQEKAAKWKNPDGHMDGLTTNGVLVMHPKGGFTEESKPGVWREISVCGDVYTLRETRSAQTPGKLVRTFLWHLNLHECDLRFQIIYCQLNENIQTACRGRQK